MSLNKKKLNLNHFFERRILPLSIFAFDNAKPLDYLFDNQAVEGFAPSVFSHILSFIWRFLV
jgi:hypothetical protein